MVKKKQVPAHLVLELLQEAACFFDQRSQGVIDFDKLDCSQVQSLTGLTKIQFSALCAELDLRTSANWSPMNSVGVYLMKLKTSKCVR